MATPGTALWATENYGPACSTDRQTRIRIFGADRIVHKGVVRHFRRLDLIFKKHAPAYYKKLCASADNWTYSCRNIAGTSVKSNHSWPIAIDLRSAENARGLAATSSEIWREAREAVLQAEREGFRWGGRYSSPDAMHFECMLTPSQIKAKYLPSGHKKVWKKHHDFKPVPKPPTLGKKPPDKKKPKAKKITRPTKPAPRKPKKKK